MDVSNPTTVPGIVLTHLLGGMVNDTARDTLRDWKPGEVIHLGDPFGLVLVWLWKSNPDLAVSVFGDLIAQLRHWEPNATQQITLDGVLDGLPFALQGLTEQEEAALIARLRRDVPKHFDLDPNSVPSPCCPAGRSDG